MGGGPLADKNSVEPTQKKESRRLYQSIALLLLIRRVIRFISETIDRQRRAAAVRDINCFNAFRYEFRNEKSIFGFSTFQSTLSVILVKLPLDAEFISNLIELVLLDCSKFNFNLIR